MKQKLMVLVIGFALLSCSPKPQAIVYGSDGCHYCKMTIVDRIHAAEIVTDKGKVYTFDAIECMLNYDKEIEVGINTMYLVNHYGTPEELINASEATFLISKNIPSPMGAFLTAFETKNEAVKIKMEKEGEIYSWEELLEHLK